ncbi:MAG TPA: DUF4070 domain-containing protein, partial [Candidatus Cloacimonadota bacterium]|nr:DUF4070 domain-containing protein [Candidatus Cloacimonadota bacterium]
AVRSGCRGLFIGLESLSQDNLHNWHKDFNRSLDYQEAIWKLHRHGIAVLAAIVFGHDWDGPEVFEQTLDFLLENNVDALQCTILTPFPGTPLFQEMDSAGRIIDKDWAKYDFKNVVFQPKRMSRATLKAGYEWVLTNFYSSRNAFRRIRNELGYLFPDTVLLGSLPLNIAYQYRFQTNGIWHPERSIEKIIRLEDPL